MVPVLSFDRTIARIISNEKDIGNKDKIADASKYVYVEVHNGEQLKGIQNYVKFRC